MNPDKQEHERLITKSTDTIPKIFAKPGLIKLRIGVKLKLKFRCGAYLCMMPLPDKRRPQRKEIKLARHDNQASSGISETVGR
jgi:hypothetical protein